MSTLVKTTIAAVIGASLVFAGSAALSADAKPKNWTPPAYKIYGQKLTDETMTKHPELLSVTLHGVPPGQDDVYTMFAGSFPDRIGNPDDPDDIDVIKKGMLLQAGTGGGSFAAASSTDITNLSARNIIPTNVGAGPWDPSTGSGLTITAVRHNSGAGLYQIEVTAAAGNIMALQDIWNAMLNDSTFQQVATPVGAAGAQQACTNAAPTASPVRLCFSI